MPNTEVKLLSAKDTYELPCWENRTSPDLYSSLAQLVERSAVNRDVVGSNPIRGAIWRDTEVVITALP